MIAFLQFLNPFDAAWEVVHQQVQPKLRQSKWWIAAVVSILDGLRCCSQPPRVLNHSVSKGHRPMISNIISKHPSCQGAFQVSTILLIGTCTPCKSTSTPRWWKISKRYSRHFSLLITLQGQRIRPHAQRIIEVYQGVEAGNTFLTRLDETIRGELIFFVLPCTCMHRTRNFCWFGISEVQLVREVLLKPSIAPLGCRTLWRSTFDSWGSPYNRICSVYPPHPATFTNKGL